MFMECEDSTSNLFCQHLKVHIKYITIIVKVMTMYKTPA